jgi:ATP-dependent DNA helicase RecG
MTKIKIFISSVQSEFAKERMELHDYLLSDALLGKFFEPFLFELLPATDFSASHVYLREVEQSSIYLGILGDSYGFEDNEGVSPTEREFDHATLHHKTRFVFLTHYTEEERHKKENNFIKKVQSALVRKQFCSTEELKLAVYSSLVNYLIEKEIIRTAPFDASTNSKATIDNLDKDKIIGFVRLANSKRGFPLAETSTIEEILTHLNLYNEGKLTNAAILLFGKEPQHFFINSEVRCAFFYGINVEKPIPSYKVFKGDVFELVKQTEEFVLSKLDYSIGTRSESTSIPGTYEIPKEIVSEAIVNAVAHRDYTCNGSIQVMLFKDRLEIWNPGCLPLGWTTEKLKKLHRSVPANPLLADPMYLAGYIERLGTGTADIVRIAREAGLQEPEFIQDDDFKTIIYRKTITGQATVEATMEVTMEVTMEAKKVVLVLNGEMKRADIQKTLQLKNDENFRLQYIIPTLELGYIEMKYPDNPKHPDQKYRLTKKGLEIKKLLEARK